MEKSRTIPQKMKKFSKNSPKIHEQTGRMGKLGVSAFPFKSTPSSRLKHTEK
jgi:hypothetical protein